MIKTIDLGGGIRAVITTRAAGRVRIAIEHQFHDQCRVDVDPMTASELAVAISSCAMTVVTGRGQTAGEGPRGAVPQRQAGGARVRALLVIAGLYLLAMADTPMLDQVCETIAGWLR